MATDYDAIQQLKDMLDKCRRAVFFTGAGVSTESGIPDFRSPGGFWTKYKPIDFSDFMLSKEMRRETWRRKIYAQKEFGHAEPNRGHRAIAKLVADNKVASVITQNIDGLHQRSGVPADQIIELHGNSTYATCLKCNRRYDLEPILADFEETGEPADCSDCGGHLKPATISFGQPMPLAAVEQAEMEASACDLFVVAGSSLVVYPAAAVPVIARRHGAQVVILNREPTELDEIAALVLHCEIGPTLGAVTGVD
ncbi:MAG TPA: Sir2 family NAD-dependent protein deacetylase [Blastocatellia bacterium]|nr:Sir2 family NAD-dependent protein deacetylase [Blastocatellia bacterium]